MLSLDLFDSRFEKKLHEGAVDDTIAHLIEPLSRRAMDIRTQLRTGRIDPKQVAKLEQEYESLVQKRLDIILDRKPTQEQQTPPPAKGLLKGKDLVTPQQRVAGATPAKPGVAGAVKDVAGGLKRWLKGEPDQGPTYEAQELDEQNPKQGVLDLQTDPKTEGEAVYQQLVQAYKAEVPYVKIPFMREQEVATLSKQGIYNVLASLLTMNTNRRQKAIDSEFGNFETFMFFIGRAKPFKYRRPPENMRTSSQAPIPPRVPATPPATTPTSTPASASQPTDTPKWEPFKDLNERQSQKKKSDGSVKDARLARELQKARARFPSADSALEAGFMDQLETNDSQDSVIKDLEQQLAQVKNQNQTLAQTVQDVTAQIDKLAVAPRAAPSAGVPVQPATTEPTKIATPATAPEVLPLPGEVPADVAAQDEKARAEIQKLNQQITKLQQTMAARPDQQKALQGQIATLKLTVDELQAERQAAIEKKKQSAVKAATTRKANLRTKKEKEDELAKSELNALLGRLRPEKAIKKSVPVSTEPETVEEHGGGIGPRQHWQSLMREGRMKQALDDYTSSSDEEFYKKFGITKREFYNTMTNAKTKPYTYKAPAMCPQCGKQNERCVCESVKETFAMPGTTIPGKSVIQGYTVFWNPKTQVVSVTRGGDSEEAAIEQARVGTPSMKNFRQAADRLIDRIESDEDQIINEGVKDTASATAVIACLLVGGSLTGCATAPQQTTTAQAVKTGQDVGRIIYNAKNITRAGTEEEARQELRNILRGMTTRPEELNNSNIIRIWRKINEPKQQNEAREISSKEDFIRERDRLLRMIGIETDPANKQILKSAIRQLENRAENEGWITIQSRMIREDTAALAAEDAILKRIFVKHRNLMMEYGPDKITQAAESVAYNVGDIAHITDDQITEWVDQVEYILGARP